MEFWLSNPMAAMADFIVPVLAVVALRFYLPVSGRGPAVSLTRLQIALDWMLDYAPIWLVTFAVAATPGRALGRRRPAA